MIALLVLLSCSSSPDSGGPPDLPGTDAAVDAGPDLVVLVGEAVRFEGGSPDAQWTFGDGEGATGVVVTHTWEEPGHYAVQVKADGNADTALVTVHYPTTSVDSSSPVVVVDGTAYAVLPDADRVAIVDLQTEEVSHLQTCGSPQTVAVLDPVVVVACRDDAVDMFDAGELVSRTSLAWGTRPFGVIHHDGGAAVTLQGTGEIAYIDWVANTVEVDPVGPDLRGIAAVGSDLYATRFRSPADGGRFFQTSSTGALSTHVVAFAPGPDSDTHTRGLPNYLQQIVPRPDGRVAAVVGLKANIERGLYNEGVEFTHDTTVRADARIVSLSEEEGAVGSEVDFVRLDDRDLVLAAAWSPIGDQLYLASHGAEDVDIRDGYTFEPLGVLFDVGHGLDGLAVADDTLWVLASLSRELVGFDVSDPAAQVEVARIDLLGSVPEPLTDEVLLGKQIFHRSGDRRMSAVGYVSCGSCHLHGDADGLTWDFTERGEGLRNTISLQGHQVDGPFHWSANFDEIQDFEHDIRGPMGGQGFLSDDDWAATDDTLGPSKSGLSVELDALAAYVASVAEPMRSPYREVDGALTAEGGAGQALFATLGCDTCHPPPSYSDSALVGGEPSLHDVGTLTDASGSRMGTELVGLDTPSLRGLHDTAPYLHDGSAATLREVLIDRNPSGEHGPTAGLSDTELDELVAFLLQLE